MWQVNIDLKATIGTSKGVPLCHSLEHRLKQLNQRFSLIEASIARLETHAKGSLTQVPRTNMEINPEWAPCSRDTPEVAALRKLTRELGLRTTVFRWVPIDYYSHGLKWRRDTLGSGTVDHLCKAVLLENTHCSLADCSNANNSKYYVAVVQYTRRFDADKVARFVRGLNDGRLSKKHFNFRLAADGSAIAGFPHNAIVPFGMKTQMPILLDDSIAHLTPRFFWMGGGHVDCKLKISVDEFVERFHPFVCDITVPCEADELAALM